MQASAACWIPFCGARDFETTVVESGERALETLRDGNITMMVSDVRMPGLSGLETLRRARQMHATLPVLLVTAYADIREAVGAMRDGAVNYLAKPIDLDELLASVQQATGISKSAPLRYDEDRQLPAYVVAKSPLMQAVFRDVSLVAPSDTRVLITGESGVGKEVLADVIHAWSARVRRAAGEGQLRRDPRDAAGKRAVRARTRLVHRRARAADRPIRGSQRRHDLSRRNRRDDASSSRPNSCASPRTDGFSASAPTARFGPTPGSWPPAIAISRRRSRTAGFAKTCSTGSTWSS